MAKKSATEKLTYAEAAAGIEEILSRLRSEEIGVDELAREVTRATELIAFCKGRLYDAETAVSGLLAKDDAAEVK
ncbi:MAG: exodeoxyribonuclease VII small subunit [Alistipes sp.]|nr:exodeoxyribonuclease VII small subunit [Alistipes sp.]